MASTVREIMRAIGSSVRGPGRVYLTGGASAVLIGWRESTIDVDLRLDPEPAGVFEAIRDVKQRLDVNLELASPQDFIPELPDWRARSESIGLFGRVSFFHYDFYAQALSKLERGHARDRLDVEAMRARGLVEPSRALALFDAIEPLLLRYPRLDARAFRARVEAWAEAAP